MNTLEQRVQFLENKVAELEEALQNQSRVYGPITLPAPFPDPIVPWYDQKNKCPKCGLVCEGAMGYCCPNNPCPMGMGGVTC